MKGWNGSNEKSGDDLPNYHTSVLIAAAVKSKSLAELRKSCVGEQPLLMFRCMLAFATLGDQDSAYALVNKLYPTRVGRTPAETERIGSMIRGV